MKKLVIALSAVVLMLAAASSSFAAAAAPASEERVGTIEPQSVLFQHPKYEQTLKQIQSIAEKKQEEAKAAIDKETDREKQARLFEEMRMSIAAEEQKLMSPLFQDIDIAIRTVATAKKITVVVDKTAIFFGGLDITNDIVQELKKQSVSK